MISFAGRTAKTEIDSVKKVKLNAVVSMKGDKKKLHIGHVSPSSLS